MFGISTCPSPTHAPDPFSYRTAHPPPAFIAIPRISKTPIVSTRIPTLGASGPPFPPALPASIDSWPQNPTMSSFDSGYFEYTDSPPVTADERLRIPVIAREAYGLLVKQEFQVSAGCSSLDSSFPTPQGPAPKPISSSNPLPTFPPSSPPLSFFTTLLPRVRASKEHWIRADTAPATPR